MLMWAMRTLDIPGMLAISIVYSAVIFTVLVYIYLGERQKDRDREDHDK